MWFLRIFVVLFIVLQSHAGNSFNEFMPGEALYSSTKETLTAMLFHGVSNTCSETLIALDYNTRWKYFDSWGKPGSGILSGNVKWFGAFDQCIRIPDAKYCLVNVLGKFHANMTIPIWSGICVPKACDLADTFSLVENFVNNVSHVFFPNIRVVDISCYKEQSLTTGVVLTIIFCCAILACCAIGTAIEVCQESFENGNKSDGLTKHNGIERQAKDQVESSFLHEVPKVMVTETTPLIRASKKENGYVDDLKLLAGLEKDPKPTKDDIVTNTQQSNRNGFLVDFFLCFSVLRNSRDVFRTDIPPGAVTSLYGIRVISMLWIILAHVFALTRDYGIIENITELYKATENLSMMVITNSYPAVDSFFYISGLLLMYNVMKRLKRSDGEIHWGKFYLHRYLRLTPVMMFVVLFVVQLEPFVDKGPLWQQHLDLQTCDKYWWTNLLYINNFYPTNVSTDSCMVWTWYLAVDMQLFLFSPVVIYLFYRYGYRGVLCTSFVLGSASIICIALLTKHYNTHPLAPSMYKASRVDEFNYLHVKPYCRIHAFLIGLVMGYLMQTSAFRVKQLQWRFVVIFWFFAAAIALSLIYAPFTAMRENPRIWTMTEKILYSSTRHLAWGIVLAWVTYACEYGCGGYVQEFLSARFWIPLGRLTYCAYLVHSQLITVMYFGYRSGLFYSAQWWAYIYCAAVLMSHGIAFILVIAVEYPCANLEKLLFRRIGRLSPK